jgi:hypothetical protein
MFSVSIFTFFACCWFWLTRLLTFRFRFERRGSRVGTSMGAGMLAAKTGDFDNGWSLSEDIAERDSSRRTDEDGTLAVKARDFESGRPASDDTCETNLLDGGKVLAARTGGFNGGWSPPENIDERDFLRGTGEGIILVVKACDFDEGWSSSEDIGERDS